MTKPLFVTKQCSQNCHRLINCTLLRFNKTKRLSCQRKIAVGKRFKVMSKTFNIWSNLSQEETKNYYFIRLSKTQFLQLCPWLASQTYHKHLIQKNSNFKVSLLKAWNIPAWQSFVKFDSFSWIQNISVHVTRK